jgi:membrane protease YdiL (CAAX protease family)
MSSEIPTTSFGINEKISNAILFFLLLIRLIDQYLPVWIFGANTPDGFRHWYAAIAYILTVAIVWLNKHRLAALNIDRPFLAALILGGVLHAFYLKYAAGIFVGITAGLIFFAYQTNQLVVGNPVPYPKRTILLILLTVLLALAPVLLFQLRLKTALDLDVFITTFSGILITNLAVIAFEEVIFRGALWAYVRSLGLGEQAAFYTQAILFWISHHGFVLLPNPYLFWVSVPILAILLGLMTWRSKSLTPSTISHFLFNFTSLLITQMF